MGAEPGAGTALTADEVIALLGLEPHPEGGAYRETWRHQAGSGGRGAGTAIYFLLRGAEAHRWHRVDAAELWHHYAGAPVELEIVGATRERVVVGDDLRAGQRPQAIVPAGAWQRARSLGDFTLVGCTVSPAFVFDTFELAPPDWEPPPP